MATGLIGMADPRVKSGDVVCVLFGGSTAFILRPLGVGSNEDKRYEYISHAYVQKIMDGEALKQGKVHEWLHLVECG